MIRSLSALVSALTVGVTASGGSAWKLHQLNKRGVFAVARIATSATVVLDPRLVATRALPDVRASRAAPPSGTSGRGTPKKARYGGLENDRPQPSAPPPSPLILALNRRDGSGARRGPRQQPIDRSHRGPGRWCTTTPSV